MQLLENNTTGTVCEYKMAAVDLRCLFGASLVRILRNSCDIPAWCNTTMG